MSEDQSRPVGLFLVGTDTGVGKTFLAARIARQLMEDAVSVGIYKPACSGSVTRDGETPFWQDVEIHYEALSRQFARERICPQAFQAALAPPVAARLENRRVDEELLRAGADWWRSRVEFLLVEGVGGLLCPLSENLTVCDLAEQLGYPLLVVGRLGLGTINHTLLTLEVARRRGLQVAGIVLNESQPGEGGLAGETNAREIARHCNVPILAVVGYQESAGLRPLAETSKINWRSVARLELPKSNPK